MGVVLKEGDGVKLKYPTSVMIASRASGKSNSATCLHFFDNGEWLSNGGLPVLLALEHAAEWPRGRAGSICFRSGHPDYKKGFTRAVLSLPWVSACPVGRVYGQHGPAMGRFDIFTRGLVPPPTVSMGAVFYFGFKAHGVSVRWLEG